MYFGNDAASLGTTFEGALQWKIGETGKFKPQGRMPFALPKIQKAVTEQKSDLPDFGETTDSTLYKFGHGLSY